MMTKVFLFSFLGIATAIARPSAPLSQDCFAESVNVAIAKSYIPAITVDDESLKITYDYMRKDYHLGPAYYAKFTAKSPSGQTLNGITTFDINSDLDENGQISGYHCELVRHCQSVNLLTEDGKSINNCSQPGVGLVIVNYNHVVNPHISEVIPGSPASASKVIAVGDKLLAVTDPEKNNEWVDVTDMHLDFIASMMRGQEGTFVSLRLQKSSGQVYEARLSRTFPIHPSTKRNEDRNIPISEVQNRKEKLPNGRTCTRKVTIDPDGAEHADSKCVMEPLECHIMRKDWIVGEGSRENTKARCVAEFCYIGYQLSEGTCVKAR